MSCEILYELISNSMQTAITYRGTVLECALENSCQAALKASFSNFFFTERSWYLPISKSDECSFIKD